MNNGDKIRKEGGEYKITFDKKMWKILEKSKYMFLE